MSTTRLSVSRESMVNQEFPPSRIGDIGGKQRDGSLVPSIPPTITTLNVSIPSPSPAPTDSLSGVAEHHKTVEELMKDVPVEPFTCNPYENIPFYNLPSCIGYKNHDVTLERAPAATIKGRPPERVDYTMEGPGPGAYNATGVTRYGKINTASANLGTKRHIPTDERSPGPAAYSPEKHDWPRAPKAPRARILGRNWPKGYFEESPGPGDYSAEKVMGTKLPRLEASPAYTIKGRPRDLNFYAESGPGPGWYNYDSNKFLPKAPSPRLLGRVYDSIPIGPGPGNYDPKPSLFGRRSPSFKFSGRLSKCARNIILKEDAVELVEDLE